MVDKTEEAIKSILIEVKSGKLLSQDQIKELKQALRQYSEGLNTMITQYDSNYNKLAKDIAGKINLVVPTSTDKNSDKKIAELFAGELNQIMKTIFAKNEMQIQLLKNPSKKMDEPSSGNHNKPR